MTNYTFLGVPELSQCQSQNTATLAKNKEMNRSYKIFLPEKVIICCAECVVHPLQYCLQYSTPTKSVCIYLHCCQLLHVRGEETLPVFGVV